MYKSILKSFLLRLRASYCFSGNVLIRQLIPSFGVPFLDSCVIVSGSVFVLKTHTNTNALSTDTLIFLSLLLLSTALTEGHCSCLHSSYLLAAFLTHTHTHMHLLPPACIYLFVIFPNSLWRMSDSLTLHSARLIERHNIYVAETANYPTIYHPDYLSDWKLLVHVIGIIWN